MRVVCKYQHRLPLRFIVGLIHATGAVQYSREFVDKAPWLMHLLQAQQTATMLAMLLQL